MMNKEVSAFIEQATEEQQEILRQLRTLIQEAVPGAVEQYKWSRPVYAVGKDFCYLKTAKKYVTLGFFNFEKVEDPKKLLEGTGKQMRHIKIPSQDSIQTDLFRQMLQQAAIE